jgi:ribosomal protein L37AE/L43A
MSQPYQAFYDCPTCGVGSPKPKITEARKLAWICDTCDDCIAITDTKPSNEVPDETATATPLPVSYLGPR